MNYKLLIDLHKEGARQGPGGDKQTKLALTLSGLLTSTEKLNIADIGSGTGASTFVLAQNLNADIAAVDLSSKFLSILSTQAEKKGLMSKIKTITCSMDNLPFSEQSLDVIWAEGAIYNLGFEKGLAYLKRFLKPGGILAASEITWLTKHRPDEITHYWNKAYPEIATSSNKIRILEEQGFILMGYFPLPDSCWLDNYYEPLQNRFDAFLTKNNTEEARSMIDEEIKEIELYNRHSAPHNLQISN